MGCGSGILGIIAGIKGAKEITFIDMSQAAIENTKENVERFNLENKSFIFNSNLFDKVEKKADLIIFDHTFFLDYIIEDLLLEKPKFEKAKLIHRFLEKAKNYLAKNGVIIMPYLHLAGKKNNPGIQAIAYSYLVEEVLKANINITQGKTGQMSIYRISIK